MKITNKLINIFKHNDTEHCFSDHARHSIIQYNTWVGALASASTSDSSFKPENFKSAGDSSRKDSSLANWFSLVDLFSSPFSSNLSIFSCTWPSLIPVLSKLPPLSAASILTLIVSLSVMSLISPSSKSSSISASAWVFRSLLAEVLSPRLLSELLLSLIIGGSTPNFLNGSLSSITSSSLVWRICSTLFWGSGDSFSSLDGCLLSSVPGGIAFDFSFVPISSYRSHSKQDRCKNYRMNKNKWCSEITRGKTEVSI